MHLGGGPLVVATLPTPSQATTFVVHPHTIDPDGTYCVDGVPVYKPPAAGIPVILSEFELLPGNEYTHAFDGTDYEAHTLQADVVHGDGVLQAWRPLAGIQIGGWQTFRVRRLDSNPWPLRVRITGVCR